MTGIYESFHSEYGPRKQSGGRVRTTRCAGKPLRRAGDGESVSEIAFGQMLAGDTILIHTQNSRYAFSVISPVEHRGILAGGAIGARPVNAILVASAMEQDGSVRIDCSKLRPGSRVVCLITSNKGFGRLITSTVERLLYVNAETIEVRARGAVNGSRLSRDLGFFRRSC